MFILLFTLIPLVFTDDYFLTIAEKTPINQTIYQFSRSYDLLTNFQSNFNLTTNKKSLILTKLIDRDYWCAQSICSCESCSFILELISNENKSSPVFSTLNITITDVNDHAAQFLDIQTNISLSESIQIGHRFPLARAIDYDSGANSQLTFRLLENKQLFDLDIIPLTANEYAIYAIVKHGFDREIQHQYQLIIEARDHSLEQVKTNQTKILIQILDENDNAPKFNQTEYSIHSLPENTPIGIDLLTITATDADIGLNSLIHYSIIKPPNQLSFPFTINSTTGVIRLSSPLDFETTRSYRFLIRASDSGLPQSLYTDTWLSISIKDVNDCPVDVDFVPNRRFQYENQSLFIHENTEIKNLTLGYIRLSDRDSIPTKLSIVLLDQNEHIKQNYELVPWNQINSYRLILKQGIFDREAQTAIKLRSLTTDSLSTSNFELNIHLIDLNDNPSEFPSNPMRFSVEELANYQMNQPMIDNYQLTIGYLNATDRDQGENAFNRYELESNPFVRIDGQTGQLFLVQPLDREELPKLILKGKAVNIAEPKWETSVTIEIDVLDVNDNIPQCVNIHYRLTVPENFPIDEPLIRINAIDRDYDLNGTIKYSFRQNDSWPFEINAQTGEIYSRELFDYESNSKEFSLTIELEDQGEIKRNRNENACQLKIFIEDINDNAPELIDEQQTRIFLDLQKPFTNEIIVFNIADRDSGDNGRIRLSLKSDRDDSLFIIYQNGSLHMTRSITQVSVFIIKLILEDYGQPAQQTTIDITIAIGDSSIPTFSSFEKVLSKHAQPKSIGLIIGLLILIITIVLFCCLILSSILLRKHRQRHQAALIARKQLLCSSTQQLTSSASTNTASSTSIEHQHTVQILPTYSQSIAATPDSNTYKIYHIPKETEYYMNYYCQEKVDTHSSDHGYQGSYETGSSSSPASQMSVHRSYMVNQLPDFVTKCKSINGGYLIEMNVDGSDEDARSN